MRRDIVSAEAELAITVNQITDYAEFLVVSIEKYVQILADVQEDGINDDMICARLTELAEQVSGVKQVIADECEDVRNRVNQFIRAVEQADQFRFSNDMYSSVVSILRQLL